MLENWKLLLFGDDSAYVVTTNSTTPSAFSLLWLNVAGRDAAAGMLCLQLYKPC